MKNRISVRSALFLFSSLTIASLVSLSAHARGYCNTDQKCEKDGGRISKLHKKCLYNEGGVKSFVPLCSTPDYGIPFGCANGEDDDYPGCDYNNPDGYRD